MINVLPGQADFIVDLRGAEITSVLTGTLRSNYKIAATEEITVTDYGRYYTVAVAPFAAVQKGDYDFEIINSNNTVIYRERLRLAATDAITHEANDIEFEHKTHTL